MRSSFFTRAAKTTSLCIPITPISIGNCGEIDIPMQLIVMVRIVFGKELIASHLQVIIFNYWTECFKVIRPWKISSLKIINEAMNIHINTYNINVSIDTQWSIDKHLFIDFAFCIYVIRETNGKLSYVKSDVCQVTQCISPDVVECIWKWKQFSALT